VVAEAGVSALAERIALYAALSWIERELEPTVRAVHRLLPQNRSVRIGLLDRLRDRLAYRRRFGAAATEIDIINRLARVMRELDARLSATGFMTGGKSATLADRRAAGAIAGLDGLDGWETVRARRHVVRWLRTLGTVTNRPETYDEDDQAQLDARRLRVI
jgi:glutathione S-transferase